MTYEEFINSKVQIAPKTGFDVADEEICTNLKPHQKIAVKWAIAGGRRAIFANFGLGKTVIQLEILHLITQHKGGKALIVAPFDVMPEFDNDAVNILKIAPPVFIRSNEEVKNNDSMLFITNYESVREGKVDVKQFTATSLDEASVLRSFGSKTYQSFLDMFKGVKYKFVNTATPSPNRYKELIHYGGYLEIMDTGQALTRFFKRDSTKANNLTLNCCLIQIIRLLKKQKKRNCQLRQELLKQRKLLKQILTTILLFGTTEKKSERKSKELFKVLLIFMVLWIWKYADKGLLILPRVERNYLQQKSAFQAVAVISKKPATEQYL